MIGIDKKGVKDVAIMAKDSREAQDLATLYHDIEPAIETFENLIKRKLKLEESIDLGG